LLYTAVPHLCDTLKQTDELRDRLAEGFGHLLVAAPS
jgi:hypothetical protein